MASYYLLTFRGEKSSNAEKVDSVEAKDFNRLAAEYFIKNVETADFVPLKPVTICYISETIKNDLDGISQSEIIQVDSFTLRTYHAGSFNYDFTFVATSTGKFYMVNLTTFHNFAYFSRDYCSEIENQLFPRDSSRMLTVSKFQLDDFLKNEIDPFSMSNESKVKLINDVLSSSIEYFKVEVTKEEFVAAYKKEIAHPIVKEKLRQLLSSSYDQIRFCDVQHLGCLIFVTSVSNGLSKVDVYLVPPEKFRWTFASDVLPPYKHCAEK